MARAEWRAVAIDHWVAVIGGRPVSVKKWPDGWILCRRYAAKPALRFETLACVLEYLS
jgi:hypothetical protein